MYVHLTPHIIWAPVAINNAFVPLGMSSDHIVLLIANISGNYSCLLAELYLKRSLGFHMVQSYIPTILIVVISWVSFWMDVDSVAGRTTLGVTTLLAVSSKSSGMV